MHIVYLLLLINLNLLTQLSLWRLLASRVLCVVFLIEEMQVKAGKKERGKEMQSERETAAVSAFDPLTQHELNGATYESILPYRSRSPCPVPLCDIWENDKFST